MANRDFVKEIKAMFNKYDQVKFCHEMVMLAKHSDFDSLIEGEGPIESIFNLAIEYSDNTNNPKKQELIWAKLSQVVKYL